MVGGVGDGQVAVGAEPVGEEVVEHAAVLAAQDEYCAPPSAIFGDVVGEQPLQERLRACGPAVSISPMWETSKMPAAVRTATCSSRMPAYWTGISQPANGTSRAAGRDVTIVQRSPLQGLRGGFGLLVGAR